MLPTILNLMCVLASGVLGAAVASWVWQSHIRRQAAAAIRSNSLPAAGAADRQQKLAAQMAVDFAVKLHELVTQVAFDVGEHNSQVQEINHQLTAPKGRESTKVLDVVVKLVEANQAVQEKLAATEQKLRQQSDRMQMLLAETRTDALTLLANRRAFDDELARRFAEFRREGRTFSLTIVDVDHFKDFNDAHGRQAGDELLRHVAKSLRRKMQEVDVVARYDGGEFAIIHPGTALADACKAAQRACEAIAKSAFAHDGHEFRAAASLGVAEVLAPENADETLKRADTAKCASKEAGGNCVHFHDGNASCRVAAIQDAALASTDCQPPVPGSGREDEKTLPAQEAVAPARADAAAEPDLPLDLPGRTRFCQQVRNRMAEWKRGGPGFSIALIEICQFGERADGLGQSTREVASRAAARCLLASIREMDLLGGYTPDCFALMMPTTGLADALRVMDRLSGTLLQDVAAASGAQAEFVLSIGVVQAIYADDATSVLKRAEMALDAAERKGGNRVYCHDGERVAPIVAMLEMEAAGCLE
jgi:diguanylate cyclase